jgi:hypothetical protein
MSPKLFDKRDHYNQLGQIKWIALFNDLLPGLKSGVSFCGLKTKLALEILI